MRNFEKVNYDEFKKCFGDNKVLYNSYELPSRKTKCSAGYDFKAIESFSIKPGEVITIPTGIKARMNSDEMLMIVVRSSTGIKYNVRMCNQIGIIESDYYNNINNDGHLFVTLQNHGNVEYTVGAGDRYIQGIFTKFLTIDNEEEINEIRIGGIGSTDTNGRND